MNFSLKSNPDQSHACIICRPVLSNLLNLIRGGTSGSGIKLPWEEESTEGASVDIYLLAKGGAIPLEFLNGPSSELLWTDAKP